MTMAIVYQYAEFVLRYTWLFVVKAYYNPYHIVSVWVVYNPDIQSVTPLWNIVPILLHNHSDDSTIEKRNEFLTNNHYGCYSA